MAKNLEEKIERVIRFFKEVPEDSILGRIEHGFKFFYALDIGGSVIRRFQRRIANEIGWEEKNLTIANAAICGVVPSVFVLAGNYFFGDRAGESFQDTFYKYEGWVVVQSIARISYSQITKKAIGSISIWNAIFTPIYALQDVISNRKTETKPLEGFEPPTPSLQNSCSDR